MSRKYNSSETEVINNIINNIKENTIIYITTQEDGEMMFICKRVGHGFTLHSTDNGNYSPVCSLEEIKEILQEDWVDGVIEDINIYDDDGGQVD
jgi:hypothetical protein